MYFIMPRDKANMKKAEAIMNSNIHNTSCALVSRNSTSVDIMKYLINYARAFDLDYAVRIFEAYINDIVDNTLSPDHLSTRSLAT